MQKSNPSQASAASWQVSGKRGQPLQGCWRLRSVDRLPDGLWPASRTSLSSQQPRPLWSAGTIWSQPWVSSPWGRQEEETQAGLGRREGVGREAEENLRLPSQGGCLPHSWGQSRLGVTRRGKTVMGAGTMSEGEGMGTQGWRQLGDGRKRPMKVFRESDHVVLRRKHVYEEVESHTKTLEFFISQ